LFRGYLIAADATRRDWLHALAHETGQVQLQGSFDRYPETHEWRQFARQLDPDFVLLDFLYSEAACGIVAAMQNKWPHCAWIGVDGGASVCHGEMPFPGSLAAAERAIFHAIHQAAPAREGARLYSFVPAKAGSGASTVAWNAAHATARLGQRVLLMEADLRAGALSYVLKDDPPGTMQSALEAAVAGDEHRMGSSIVQVNGRLDLLLSNRLPVDPLPRWDAFYALLAYLRPRYDVLVADLPELINPGSSELVRSSSSVFVVTTPELLPLKLAEHRCREIQDWGVEPDALRLILNRTHRNELTAKDVEENLQRPVAHSFPNDYYAVRKSILAGDSVHAGCALADAFQKFARVLHPVPVKPPQTTGLLSYFQRLRD